MSVFHAADMGNRRSNLNIFVLCACFDNNYHYFKGYFAGSHGRCVISYFF